jgi:hypothetical protein
MHSLATSSPRFRPMRSTAQQHRAKARECARLAAAAEHPGVKRAYQRAAAQLSDIAGKVRASPRRPARSGDAARAGRRS